MLDFMTIRVRKGKNGTTITPIFNTTVESTDILVKGKNLYGFWDNGNNKWVTKWERAAALVDKEIMKFSKGYVETHPDESVNVELLSDDTTGAAKKNPSGQMFSRMALPLYRMVKVRLSLGARGANACVGSMLCQLA